MTNSQDADDAAVDRPLPDPGQEQRGSAQGAFDRAAQAAARARRMIEASRGLLIGNMALVWALMPLVLHWWENAERDHLLVVLGGCGLLIASVSWTIYCAASLQRIRAAGGMHVVDRQEAQFTRDAASWRTLFPRVLFGIGAATFFAVGWSYAFAMMPDNGVAVSMWAVTTVAPIVFIVRYVRYQFWEDLLFGAGIFAAWALYLGRAHQLAPLGVIPLLGIVFGTVCLHRRWLAWTRSLPLDAPTGSAGASV